MLDHFSALVDFSTAIFSYKSCIQSITSIPVMCPSTVSHLQNQTLGSRLLGIDSYGSRKVYRQKKRYINYAYDEDMYQTFMQIHFTMKFEDGCERKTNDVGQLMNMVLF